MSLPIEAKRFKQVRTELGLTQAALAEELGIKSVADVERGRVRLHGHAVARLLERYHINPAWLYGHSKQKRIATGPETQPRVVTLEGSGNENIVAVSAKAAAGYPENLSDQEWYDALPAFHLPLPRFRSGSFRLFQVEGDSMVPALEPDEWVIAQAVSNIEDVDRDAVCVVVTATSVLIKRMQPQRDGGLRLLSENATYPPIDIDPDDVQEVWAFAGRLSLTLGGTGDRIDRLQESIDRLSAEIGALRKA